MSRRTDEGHMDWEYHSIGPVDPTSPWTAHIKQQQQKGKQAGSAAIATRDARL